VAQKIQTLFIDDIDGGAAEGTVRFALDGTDYEIDLNAKHSEELRSAIGKYVTHARKVGGSARRAGRTAGRAGRGAGSSLNTTEIRNWAREQGYDIKDRGRVPADLVAKYQAATGK
jgi:Lsr2